MIDILILRIVRMDDGSIAYIVENKKNEALNRSFIYKADALLYVSRLMKNL